jgi:hypothetical protein
MRLEGLAQLKNPMTSSGIEPATLNISETTNAKYPKIFYMNSEYKISKMLFSFHLAHEW